MVKYHSTWLSKVNANGIIIGMWAPQVDGVHMKCNLCNVKLRFATQGFQVLLQHSRTLSHELISRTRFIEKQQHFFAKSSNSGDNSVIDVDVETGSEQKEMKMGSASDLQCSAEAMWLFKVAEEVIPSGKLFKSLRILCEVKYLYPDSFCCSCILMGSLKVWFV